MQNSEELSKQIQSLRTKINNFHYNELRSRKISNNGENWKIPTEESVKNLFSIFNEFCTNQQIKQYIKSRKKQTVLEKKNISDIAEILVNFRNKIEESEKKYFLDKKENPVVSDHLKKNSTWLMRFQFMIQQHLKDHFTDLSETQYGSFVNNIKSLSQNIYSYLLVNEPELAQQEKYSVLRAKELSSAAFKHKRKEPDDGEDESDKRDSKRRRTLTSRRSLTASFDEAATSTHTQQLAFTL